MGWALLFAGGGAGQRVMVSPAYQLQVGDVLEYKGKFEDSGEFFHMFIDTYVAGGDYIAIRNDNLLHARLSGVILSGSTVINDGDDFTYILERTATQYIHTIQGVEQFRHTSTAQWAGILGFGDESFEFKGHLEYCKVDNVGTPVRNWDATASDHSNTGVQPILVETVAGNNGSGQNMPTDGSAWVDLGGGGFTLALDSGNYSTIGADTGLLVDRVITPETGTFTYSGTDLDLFNNKVFSLSPDSYSVSGSDINILHDKIISLASGNYALVGTDITLTYNQVTNYILSLDSGSYTYAGDELTLNIDRLMSLSNGTVTYIGTDINLLHDKVITLSNGLYAVTGTDVILIYNPSTGYVFTFDTGSYESTGEALDVLAQRVLSFQHGSYELYGTGQGILYNRFLILADGSYIVAGTEVDTLANRRLIPDTGIYQYTGTPIILRYSGMMIKRVDGYRVFFASAPVTTTFKEGAVVASFKF